MGFELDKLVRPNIKTLKPYSSAKDEYTGEAKVLLDANENSLGSPLTKWYNRYPDPYQQKLKEYQSLDFDELAIKRKLSLKPNKKPPDFSGGFGNI